jgi:hypothetical protein
MALSYSVIFCQLNLTLGTREIPCFLLLTKSTIDLIEEDRSQSQDNRLLQNIDCCLEKPHNEGSTTTFPLLLSAPFTGLLSIKRLFVAFGLKSSYN